MGGEEQMPNQTRMVLVDNELVPTKQLLLSRLDKKIEYHRKMNSSYKMLYDKVSETELLPMMKFVVDSLLKTLGARSASTCSEFSLIKRKLLRSQSSDVIFWQTYMEYSEIEKLENQENADHIRIVQDILQRNGIVIPFP